MTEPMPPETSRSDRDPDRLFRLLPAVHRSRDELAGNPLRDLLRVVADELDVLEDDLADLYDSWFVETAPDWVVPYLGELVGHQPVAAAGDVAAASPELARVLVPRQEVANLVRAMRRKGTLALLEELGRDVAGWPSRAVELSRLLALWAHLNFPRPDRGGTVDLRESARIELVDGPFDTLAHVADVRRISGARSPGRHHVDGVGLWVWRTRTWPLESSPAACVEEVSPSCFTFSVLGNDAPIWRRPVPESDATTIAQEENLPVPLRRRSLAEDPGAVYGPWRSFDLQVGVRRGSGTAREHVPVEKLVAADLTDWQYRPRPGTVAVDPELGRVAFPPGQAPQGLWVDHRYGTSGDLGGGGYPRPLTRPAPGTFHQTVSQTRPYPKGSVRSIAAALTRWEKVRGQQPTCVVEVLDNEVYTEKLVIQVRRGESVEVRAAQRRRPVIHLLDRTRNAPDALAIVTDEEQPGGCVRLDGLLVTGRAVHVEGALQRVAIVHCTLVPGWGLGSDCDPTRPAEPSLELHSVGGPVHVERSILGSIQVYADEVTSDPVEVVLRDSVLDATSHDREAIGAPNWPLAHAAVSFHDCTVIGTVLTQAVVMGENSIFTGRMRVARRQVGCLRYSYVSPGSRTPRRHRCQPDLVEALTRTEAAREGDTEAGLQERLTLARERVVPVFDSLRYGRPAYVRLGPTCAEEIVRGADDESEMGALHDLFQPQRLANLSARLEQFTPARSDSAVLLADQESPPTAHRTAY